MAAGKVSIAATIALRYVSVGKRSQLVSFMSALTIGGLALSIAILVSVLSVMNGFDRELRENILGVIPHASVKARNGSAQSVEQWQIVDELLEAEPDVLNHAPLLEAVGVAATDRSSKGVLVNGVDPNQESDVSALDRFMLSGSLDALSEERFRVIIGNGLAEQLGVAVGDRVSLFSPNLSVNPLAPLPNQRAFTVAGVYRVGTQELDDALVMVRLDDARALFRVRDEQTAFRLQTRDVLAVNSLSARLNAVLPPAFYSEPWTRQFGAVYENIRLSRTVVGFLLWLLVAVAAFNLVVSLIMIVRDKRGDIAILRTMGASPATIGRIFLLQGCIIGAIGTVIGMIGGIALALTISDLMNWLEGVSGSDLLSGDVYPVDFLPSQLLLSDVLLVSAGVFVLCLLASVYPAMRASRVQPASALRME